MSNHHLLHHQPWGREVGVCKAEEHPRLLLILVVVITAIAVVLVWLALHEPGREGVN